MQGIDSTVITHLTCRFVCWLVGMRPQLASNLCLLRSGKTHNNIISWQHICAIKQGKQMSKQYMCDAREHCPKYYPAGRVAAESHYGTVRKIVVNLFMELCTYLAWWHDYIFPTLASMQSGIVNVNVNRILTSLLEMDVWCDQIKFKVLLAHKSTYSFVWWGKFCDRNSGFGPVQNLKLLHSSKNLS